LKWPLQLAEGFTDIGYHGISAFVDHNNNFPSSVEDYNCGTRSYDSSTGVNHRGTDIFLWPFAWSMMKEGRVDVIAAASGIVIGKLDGHTDTNCSGQDTTSWNAVYVRHNDGSIAWYGHLKSNSLTAVPVGGWVQQGDYLGKVGSSGASTGPHLHFEVYADEDLNFLIDPFEGNCNNTNTTTSWMDQRPYFDSGINRVSTHNAFPAISLCPEPAIISDATDFCEGDAVYFLVFLRDIVTGHTVHHQLIQPDGTVFTTWQTPFQGTHQAASWVYEFAIIPDDPQIGEWKYRVDYLGITVLHPFNVCMSVEVDAPQEWDASDILVYPNPTIDIVTIEIPEINTTNTSLHIYSVDGKILFNQPMNPVQSILQFDISDFSEGIYMISIVENGQILASKRIIKI